MSRHVDFLLLGGGMTSVTAADTLRAEGAQGSILIVAAETDLPYGRAPLSKQFLQGSVLRSQLPAFSQDYLQQQRIDFLPGTRALSVDPRARKVLTDRAGSLSYGELLIATGASPRRLGVPGESLAGVHYLRTVEDAEVLRTSARTARQAVIAGGGYMGMELAATLTQMGLHVTLLVRGKHLLDRLHTASLSEFFAEYFRAQGVEILLEESVIEFSGSRRVKQVKTGSGRKIPCDLVAVCIGVQPDVGFLEGSGLEVNDGIVVNSFLHTNRPHVFAAGDVVSYYDRLFGKYRRIDHWDNAIKQGRVVAKNMLGKKQAYDECSYFFSDVFDLTFEFVGQADEADEWIERGNLSERSYALFYLKQSVLQAVFTIGRPAQETRMAESLIRNRVPLGPFKAQLADRDFSLQSIPAQTVLILQGGGALGAFECGAVKALEEQGIYPDIVAGVSIGAINAALVAAHPRQAAAALESFWNELAQDTPEMPTEALRRQMASAYTFLWGCPPFFRPRWWWPFPEWDHPQTFWTSLYDPSPLRNLLNRYIDFPKLKNGPVRLLVSAVNVETAELETFDSAIDEITADHLLASGSLPPGFPWTMIDGKPYWDGGLVSNSPLNQVIECCGARGKRVYIVDLFPCRKPLPRSLMEVMARRDEIVYSEKFRKNVRVRDRIRDFHRLVEEIVNSVDPQTAAHLRQRPRYIQLMGDLAPMSVTRIILEEESDSLQGKSNDFSRKTIEDRVQKGYATVMQVLSKR